MYRVFISFFFSCALFSAFAQTPTITPTFFAADEEITITYDVTGTSLSSLTDAWIWMWAPDFSSPDAPSNINPANSNTAATNVAKFTKTVDAGKTTFTIKLKPATFLAKSASELKRIGMLLKGNDWSDGQSSDHIVNIEGGFRLQVSSPASEFAFYTPSDVIEFRASTSEQATFNLILNGDTINTQSNTSAFSYDYVVADDSRVLEFVLAATNGSDDQIFRHGFTTTPVVENIKMPNGLHDGANYISSDSIILVLTAPTKENVYVLGDFNNWAIDKDFLMYQDSVWFWLPIGKITPGKEYTYQYLLDGSLQIADPYTEKVISSFDDPQIISENRYPDLIEFPEEGYQEVSVLQTNKTEFEWTDDDFVKPKSEDLVVYELLVRDFTEERTFKAVTEKLDYLDSLGINAIELMPINEFEGNLSWGYNPSFKFAVDKYYGTELDLKTLINEAHKRGIAIIIDMVLNHHFGRSPLVKMEASGDFGPPLPANPWFNVNATHPFNVGYDFNHESLYTQAYIDRVNTYWTEEYHVDGYRFDLSKGFTQRNNPNNVGAWSAYDASRIALLKRMADVIWNQNPETYVILEHLSDNQEEIELADYGMMLWGNMNGTYRSTAKGSSSDIGWLYHKNRGWNVPNVVGYMESHDEERVMWDLAKSSIDDFEYQMNKLKMNAAFFFLVPGPKMIWQFGEFGYQEELNNDRLGIKPTRWEYLEDWERAKLFATYQALINLKTKTNYVNDDNFSWQSSGAFKWINIDNEDVKICAYGNFTRDSLTTNTNFLQVGEWFDYLTGDKIMVEDVAGEVKLASGEFHIYTSKQIDNYISIRPVDFLTAISTESNDIAIYPNPTSSVIKFSKMNPADIALVDLSGKVLMTRSIDQWEDSLDISGLEKGVYFIKFHQGNRVIVKRVLKN